MVLAALAAHVVAGDVRAPILVAIVAAAGLVGLLVPPAAPHTLTRMTPITLAPIVLAGVFVLAANLAVLGDAAGGLGLPRAAGLVVGVVLALAVIGWTASDHWWRLVAPVGCVLVVLPLVPVVWSAGPPWTAWGTVASRSALTFREGSGWVTHGRSPGQPGALTFLEPHRVAAVSPGTWRVVERDAAHVAVREWRLGRGDALLLRPGDELLVDRGTRVRFEAGRRVPGAPSSGMAWADGDGRPWVSALVLSAGAVVTLVGGGVALAPAMPVLGPGAMLAPAMLLAFVVGAVLWGLYGMALAPELSLVPHALAPVIEVLTRAARMPSRPAMLGLATVGVAALFVGTMLAWRARVVAALVEGVAALGRPPLPRGMILAASGIVVALALALATMRDDPWRLFTVGLGIAAAAVVAPRLAGAGPRGQAAGAIVGTLACGAVWLGEGSWLPATAGVLDQYPALAAAPLAWLAARLGRDRA